MDSSSELIHALLPLYLVGVLGASTLDVGIIEGIAEATAAVTKVFSGALSDYLGKRKWLTAVGYGLAALSKPIFPLASSIAWVAGARFIDRVGKGIRGAPRDALIADLTPAGLRGTAYGLRQTLDTVGAVLGPGLAIVFMALLAGNFTHVFWIAVIPAFISVAIIVLFVREPKKRPRRARALRSPLSRAELARLDIGYWIVVGVAAIFTLARFSEAFLLLRAQSVGMPAVLVPTVMVVMNLVYALSAWPAGALSDSIGRYRLLIAGFALLIVADLVLALGGGVATVMIGVAIWGLHMGLTQGLLVGAGRRHRAGAIARHRLRRVQSGERARHAGGQRHRRRLVGLHRPGRHLPRRRFVHRDRARRAALCAPGQGGGEEGVSLSVVVPAKAGTHTPQPIDRLRSMGPGSRSLRSLGRDDSRS